MKTQLQQLNQNLSTIPSIAEVPEQGVSRKTRPKQVRPTEKILKSDFARGMTWARTFVSGPKDPLANKYSFYCQICKVNLSCRSKGATEIRRHHKTEKHLRKDQRWRYEHLRITDPVTGKVEYQVRDKYGRVLEPFELERELPKFINAELVDIGPKFPLYDDYIAGLGRTTAEPETRLNVQLSLMATYLEAHGTLSFLESLWSRVGVFANHQEMFADFDWSKEHILVSIIGTIFNVCYLVPVLYLCWLM